MSEKHVCPRREEGYPYSDAMKGPDTWRRGRAGLVGQEKVGSSCSYCGSLHPDRFMELVREGWTVGPTDKNYKAYLGPPPDPEAIARRREQWMEEAHGAAQAIRALAADAGSTAEQTENALEKAWQQTGLPFIAMSGGQEAKFYYQHLSDDQKREFVGLMNGKRVNWGYPGHPYVRPFFVSYEPREKHDDGQPDGQPGGDSGG